MAFSPYQYQPQMGGFAQPMFQPQQYQPPQQTADQPMFCRMATNRDEVQAYPVDFSGRAMTFLGPGLQTIWVKLFNSNTGGSEVIEYRPASGAKPEAPKVPSMEEFHDLQEMVRQQGEEISKLRGMTRRRSAHDQEAADNEF